MGAPKGNQNNPRGRPPKNRALTTMLEAALSKKTANGQAGNKVLAALVVELVTTGIATLPGGKVMEAAPRDWLETVKWIYTHVDGPPKAELELSGALEMLKGYTTKDVSPDAWDNEEG
jgi:hypothetical protein